MKRGEHNVELEAENSIDNMTEIICLINGTVYSFDEEVMTF